MPKPQEEGLGDTAIVVESAGRIKNEKQPETGHDGQANRQEPRNDPGDDPAPLQPEPGLGGRGQKSWLATRSAQVAKGQRFRRLSG